MPSRRRSEVHQRRPLPRLDRATTRFTSHWHMAIAMAALQEKARGKGRTTPDFVRMFKDMGVDMVHLAEFHGDGHPAGPRPAPASELQAMFDECRRLSDGELLLIPGEEANAYLGLPAPGRHPGPLALPLPQAGLLDHEARRRPALRRGRSRATARSTTSASRADMLKLLEVRRTAWPGRPMRGSRPRAGRPTSSATRTSSCPTTGWAPPGRPCPPTSPHDRLGRRVLDLLDDMANWGQRKYVLGEVDVFKLDHTHELYGHMNVNYLRLDRVPSFERGLEAGARGLAVRPVLRDARARS